MAGFPEIDRIAAQKRWTITKCELSRRRLDGSVRQLKNSTSWLPTAWRVMRGSGRILSFAWPLLDLWRGRTSGRGKKWKLFGNRIGR